MSNICSVIKSRYIRRLFICYKVKFPAVKTAYNLTEHKRTSLLLKDQQGETPMQELILNVRLTSPYTIKMSLVHYSLKISQFLVQRHTNMPHFAQCKSLRNLFDLFLSTEKSPRFSELN